MSDDKNMPISERVALALAEIKKNLECPICLDIKGDLCLTKCGHFFCQNCMATLMKMKSPNCPLCKKLLNRRNVMFNQNMSECASVFNELSKAIEEDYLDSYARQNAEKKGEEEAENTDPGKKVSAWLSCKASSPRVEESVYDPAIPSTSTAQFTSQSVTKKSSMEPRLRRSSLTKKLEDDADSTTTSMSVSLTKARVGKTWTEMKKFGKEYRPKKVKSLNIVVESINKLTTNPKSQDNEEKRNKEPEITPVETIPKTREKVIQSDVNLDDVERDEIVTGNLIPETPEKVVEPDDTLADLMCEITTGNIISSFETSTKEVSEVSLTNIDQDQVRDIIGLTPVSSDEKVAERKAVNEENRSNQSTPVKNSWLANAQRVKLNLAPCNSNEDLEELSMTMGKSEVNLKVTPTLPKHKSPSAEKNRKTEEIVALQTPKKTARTEKPMVVISPGAIKELMTPPRPEKLPANNSNSVKRSIQLSPVMQSRNSNQGRRKSLVVFRKLGKMRKPIRKIPFYYLGSVHKFLEIKFLNPIDFLNSLEISMTDPVTDYRLSRNFIAQNNSAERSSFQANFSSPPLENQENVDEDVSASRIQRLDSSSSSSSASSKRKRIVLSNENPNQSPPRKRLSRISSSKSHVSLQKSPGNKDPVIETPKTPRGCKENMSHLNEQTPEQNLSQSRLSPLVKTPLSNENVVLDILDGFEDKNSSRNSRNASARTTKISDGFNQSLPMAREPEGEIVEIDDDMDGESSGASTLKQSHVSLDSSDSENSPITPAKRKNYVPRLRSSSGSSSDVAENPDLQQDSEEISEERINAIRKEWRKTLTLDEHSRNSSLRESPRKRDLEMTEIETLETRKISVLGEGDKTQPMNVEMEFEEASLRSIDDEDQVTSSLNNSHRSKRKFGSKSESMKSVSSHGKSKEESSEVRIHRPRNTEDFEVQKMELRKQNLEKSPSQRSIIDDEDQVASSLNSDSRRAKTLKFGSKSGSMKSSSSRCKCGATVIEAEEENASGSSRKKCSRCDCEKAESRIDAGNDLAIGLQDKENTFEDSLLANITQDEYLLQQFEYEMLGLEKARSEESTNFQTQSEKMNSDPEAIAVTPKKPNKLSRRSSSLQIASCNSDEEDVVRSTPQTISESSLPQPSTLVKSILTDISPIVKETRTPFILMSQPDDKAPGLGPNRKLYHSTPKLLKKSDAGSSKKQVFEPIQEVHEEPSETKKCFICSGLSLPQIDFVKRFAKRFGAKYQNVFSPEVTHVIVRTTENNGAENTLKYLLGVAYQKWILGIQWVEDSIKENRLLEEESYEVLDGASFEPGPKRSRLRVHNIFEDYAFLCIGPIASMAIPQCEELINKVGGTFVKTLDELAVIETKMKFIIVQEDIHNNDAIISWCKKARAAAVAQDWPTECISKYRLLTPIYYLQGIDKSFLKQLDFPKELLEEEDGESFNEEF